MLRSKAQSLVQIMWCMGEVSPDWGDLTVSDWMWLSPTEKEMLIGMRFPKRRREWLSGRWTAKQLLLRCSPRLAGKPLTEISIENHINGNPVVFVEGQILPGCLSLSHRENQAAAAYLTNKDVFVGIDLEWIEERHPAFLQDYFTEKEIEWVTAAPNREHSLRTTLIWSAKESALKSLRVGLAVDTRTVEVHPLEDEFPQGWRKVNFHSNLPEEGYQLHGWWQKRENFIITIVVNMPASHKPVFDIKEIHW